MLRMSAATLVTTVAASRQWSVSAASAPGGSRTPNLLIRSQMLYPLSYRRSVPSIPVGSGAPRGRGAEHPALGGSGRLGSDEELGPLLGRLRVEHGIVEG
jgi:hypothetical protein